MNIKKTLSEQIKIDGVEGQVIYSLLETAPRDNMGDFSLPCFSLAKDLRKSPNEIAQNIAKNLEGNKYFSQVQVLNGYVNLYLNQEFWIKDILSEADKDLSNYGKKDLGKGKLVCIEFSSINIAKNPHVGHLSGTVFGESFSRLHQNFGYKVRRWNYIGDYGTQFGKMIMAYQRWGNKTQVEKEGVDALQKLYIKANVECENDEKFLEECRLTFLKLEQGDSEIRNLFDWFIRLSLDEAEKIYKQMGVSFDDWRGEAYYAQFNKPVIQTLKEKALVKQDNGALIIDLKPYDLGVAIVEQSSGASLYVTRDIGALLDRYKEFNYNKFIYVTAVQQKLYFQQLFKIAELLKLNFLNKVEHISYGMVSTPEGKISSRKGAVALVKDLFSASINRATEILNERGTISEDMENLSEQIGVSALVFHILHTTASKDSVFDLEKALNFEGETGPYLQYTFARCCSVVRNWKTDLSKEVMEKVDYSLLDNSAWNLSKLIQKFPAVLEDAFTDYEPCYIARFAVELASEFNKYYNGTRIITEDVPASFARVSLTNIVKTILEKSLYFLVMSAPEKM